MFAAVTASDAGILSRICNLKLLRSFGKYSYGIYVLHYMLLRPLDRIMSLERLESMLRYPMLSVVTRVALGAGVSFGVAWLSFHLYEKHFLRLKRFLNIARH